MRGRGPAPPAELQSEAQTTRGVSGNAAAVTWARVRVRQAGGHTVQGPVQTGETSPSSEKEEKPSFLLSWPPGFLFAMRRPLPGHGVTHGAAAAPAAPVACSGCAHLSLLPASARPGLRAAAAAGAAGV